MTSITYDYSSLDIEGTTAHALRNFILECMEMNERPGTFCGGCQERLIELVRRSEYGMVRYVLDYAQIHKEDA